MIECPVPCNLCGGSDVEVVGDRDRNGHPLRTTLCRRCGLVWSNPRPSEDEVRRYYSSEYRLDYKGRATPSLRQVARSGRGALNRYRALEPYLKAGDRILDAGAGGGEVVYVLRRLGFEAVGLEPDEAYARHAREVLNVPVSTGFVQDASSGPASVDVVTMYHALEHVENPLGILSRLRSFVGAGGMLLIEVPNVEATCLAPSNRFHFAHFYNFNRQTLEWLGRTAGFEPIATNLSADGGNVTTIFRAASAPGGPHIDSGNYARVRSVLKRHTTFGYYCSPSPYVAPVGRLRSYLLDRRAAMAGDTPIEVLDALINAHVHSR